MINKNISSTEHGGILQKNRALLDRLNRQLKAPFTIVEAANIMEIPVIKARQLILSWVSRGMGHSHKEKFIYDRFHCGTVKPKERKKNPWIVAAKVFEPCYIGGWSACEYWGLTDQIFNNIVIFSSKRMKKTKSYHPKYNIYS